MCTEYKYECPVCKKENIAIERRPNGNAICNDCRHGALATSFSIPVPEPSAELVLWRFCKSIRCKSLTKNAGIDCGCIHSMCEFTAKDLYHHLIKNKVLRKLVDAEKYYALLEEQKNRIIEE